MLEVQNIPTTLKIEGYWCKYVAEGKRKKPINPKDGKPAKINDCRTFGTFGDVGNAIGSDITLDTVGFGLGIFNPICAIDINDCVHNGKIDDTISDLILECNSYAEYSPSGTGVRIIFQARDFLLDKNIYNVTNKELKAEFICEGSNSKFLAMTGNTVNNLDVDNINLELILNKYFIKRNVTPTEVNYSIDKPNLTELNDTGYSRAFIDKFGENLKYNFDTKCWMIWNGKYWQYDYTESVKTMVEIIAEDIRGGIKSLTDVNEIKQVNNAVSYLLSRRGKDNVLNEAQHLVPILENQLDCDDYLLNTASGVLDLKNGKILDWKREFYMTKYIDIELDEKYPTQYFKFLDEIYQGNQELIEYVNNLFAYCLTGSTKEQEMYFFAGDGANGKSVLFDLMRKIWGPYSRTASAELLIDKNMQNNCKSELAMLKGVRLVFASELDTNTKLKMSIVKNITGGNEIVAKYLYKNEFTYYPKYKVLLATNHMPRVSEDDNGSKRRIKKIDHLRIFKKEEQDKYLLEKLYESERGAILNYLRMLAPEVISKGLATPECVELSVGNFFSSEDILAKWLDECTESCVTGEYSSTLFDNFRNYCLANNEMYWYKNATTTWFGRKMGKLYKKTEVDHKKYYVGVRIK